VQVRPHKKDFSEPLLQEGKQHERGQMDKKRGTEIHKNPGELPIVVRHSLLSPGKLPICNATTAAIPDCNWAPKPKPLVNMAAHTDSIPTRQTPELKNKMPHWGNTNAPLHRVWLHLQAARTRARGKDRGKQQAPCQVVVSCLGCKTTMLMLAACSQV